MFAVMARTPATAKNMKNFFILFSCVLINNVLDSYLVLNQLSGGFSGHPKPMQFSKYFSKGNV
jgi:hypothetical protein